MGEQVAWHVELAVKPGALEALRALTGKMVEATRGEPGVLSYERFLSADGMVVHVYERYADAAACGGALTHVRKAVQRPIRGPGRPHTVHCLRDPERRVACDTGQLWRDVHGPVWWFRTLGLFGVPPWEGPELAVYCCISNVRSDTARDVSGHVTWQDTLAYLAPSSAPAPGFAMTIRHESPDHAVSVRGSP